MANFSKSLLSYTDVHQAFEAAGKLGQLLLRFKSGPEATAWAGRANAYRVLLRKESERLGRPAVCQFDHLLVRRPEDRTTVLIEPRGFGFVSAVGPDGTPVDFSKTTLHEPVLLPHEEAAKEDFDEFLKDLEEKGK